MESVEEYRGTTFYTYKDEYLIFASQIGPDGTTVISYMTTGSNVIYQTKPFNINTMSTSTSTLQSMSKDLDTVSSVNASLMEDLDAYEIDMAVPVNRAQPQNQVNAAAASSALALQVEAKYGTNYNNRYLGSRTMTYDKSYQFRVYGYQTTYQQDYDRLDFEIGTAITTIKACIAVYTFSFGIKEIIDLFDLIVELKDNTEMLGAAVHGEIAVYQCNRVKQVMVPSYTSDVIYSASSVRQDAFLYMNNKWSIKEFEKPYTQPAYNDDDTLYNTALTRFINFWLLA